MLIKPQLQNNIISQLKELWKFRHLIITFVWRDLRAKYRQTTVGVLWTIIQPLSMTVVFTLIFSKFLKVSSNGVPYPAFSFIALATWTFIARSIKASATNLISNYGLMYKIYFPREVIPLSIVLTSLIDFLIAGLIMFIILAIYRIPLSWHAVFMPIIILIQILLAIAVSLFASSTTIIFRDLEFVWPFLIQIGMYASPIIYSIRNLQTRYKLLFYINPITGVVEGYRSIFLYHEIPNFIFLGISLCFSLIMMVFSYFVFKRIERYFIDVI